MNELITNKNIEIINIISKKELCIREISEKLNCSPGTVHKAVKLFKKNNLIIKKKEKNKIIIFPNRESVIYQKIKSLININLLINSKNYKLLKKNGPIGVYGSFAKGTDDKYSDIDLWIYSKKSLIKIREIVTKLEHELNEKISMIIINDNKLEKMKKEDLEFYNQLKFTSIKLENEPQFE